MSGTCGSVLGDETTKVCTANPNECVYDEGGLQFSPDEIRCTERNDLAECSGGQWVHTSCSVDLPVCDAGQCKLCSPDAASCLGLSQALRCDSSGTGLTVTATCDPFGFPSASYCYDGFPVCTDQAVCAPDAVQGCAGNQVERMVCPGSGVLPLATDPCPTGRVCVTTGECVEPDFTLVQVDPSKQFFVLDLEALGGAGPEGWLSYQDGATAVSPLLAHRVDLDAEQLVSTVSTGDGRSPSISSWGDQATGRYVLAFYAQKGGASSNEVYTRWFAPDGAEAVPETKITTGIFPDVVTLGPDLAVVVWDDLASTVVGRVIDLGGAPVDFSVGPRGNSVARPKVARHGTDGFIATWANSNTSVVAQCFDGAGTPTLGANLPVSSGGGQQSFPQIAGQFGRDAVVVWEDVQQAIRARRVNSSCQTVGAPFEVTSSDDGFAASMWADGRFVVAYEGADTSPLGNPATAIFANFYTAAGAFDASTRLTPAGFDAGTGLTLSAWGTDRYTMAWSNRYVIFMRSKTRP